MISIVTCPFQECPIHSLSWYVGVVVPAQNEERSIARCVQSIRCAHQSLGLKRKLWIVVVADTCTDDTVARAYDALRGDGEVLACRVGSVGAARALGAAAVIAYFGRIPSNTIWLANTDADTYVPVDWLERHLECADNGDVAVAGIVELDIDCTMAQRVDNAFLPMYELAANGSHEHVHGANLGVRADAYLAVGGWSSLALAEDHCLWNRLQTAGWRLRSTVRSRVTTSARLKGRAPGGFADTLRLRVANANADPRLYRLKTALQG